MKLMMMLNEAVKFKMKLIPVLQMKINDDVEDVVVKLIIMLIED